VRISSERVHAKDYAYRRTEADTFIYRINRTIEFDGDSQ